MIMDKTKNNKAFIIEYFNTISGSLKSMNCLISISVMKN